MIIKVRTAVQKEQQCAACNIVIKKGEKYADSDEKLAPPKPFPSKKYCLNCSKDMPVKPEAPKKEAKLTEGPESMKKLFRIPKVE